MDKIKAWLMQSTSINGMAAVVSGITVACLGGSPTAYVPLIVGGLVAFGLPQQTAAPLTKTAEDAIAGAAAGGAAGGVKAALADLPADITVLTPKS